MWLEFIDNFQWTPPERRRVRISFRKGSRYFVRKKCAEAALAAGKAVKVKRQAKPTHEDVGTRHNQDDQ